MSKPVNRHAAVDAVIKHLYPDYEYPWWVVGEAIKVLPYVRPVRKKMSNKEWVDFLCNEFEVSRTSAKAMLHILMRCKAEDNFKKQFNKEVLKMRFLRDNEPFSFDEDPALFETAVTYMSDDIREELHRDLAPCKPDKFMIAYCLKDLGFVEFLEREFGITFEWRH